MKVTKIDIIKAVMNRPTEEQAVSEVIKLYIQICEPKGAAAIERLVPHCRQEIKAEKSDGFDST